MYRKTFEVTGYTYDTDTHCIDCTAKRFIDGDIDYGRVHFDLDSPNIFDSGGNHIHPIFLGSEYDYQPCCRDCFAEIECTVIMHSSLSDGVYIRSESRNDPNMSGNSTLYPEIDRKGIISVVRSWL